MGLGKTIQAIATMIAMKAAGKHHFMVVCLASVLINWCREIQKFSDMEVSKIQGADDDALLHWRENGDIAVTTFESISRFELPEKFRFDYLVVDEAHYVKNPVAQRTVAIQKLLKKRLLEYAAKFPELCQQTDDDEQGGLRFEIDKSRISVRLTAPYSEERRKAASELAKETMKSIS